MRGGNDSLIFSRLTQFCPIRTRIFLGGSQGQAFSDSNNGGRPRALRIGESLKTSCVHGFLKTRHHLHRIFF